MFQSVKLFEGYSTCFRQWRAKDTHCAFLHGYAVSFEVTFEGIPDERNWVFDFGGMKRAKTQIDGVTPDEYFKYLFDHTVCVAYDDPEIDKFRELNTAGIIQLRVFETIGAEMFAHFIYKKISVFLKKETNGRVWVNQVRFFEQNKNSAIFKP